MRGGRALKPAPIHSTESVLRRGSAVKRASVHSVESVLRRGNALKLAWFAVFCRIAQNFVECCKVLQNFAEFCAKFFGVYKQNVSRMVRNFGYKTRNYRPRSDFRVESFPGVKNGLPLLTQNVRFGGSFWRRYSPQNGKKGSDVKMARCSR